MKQSELSRAVIWPNGPRAEVNLLTHEGELLAEYKISEPVLGSELAKLVPAGCRVSWKNCYVQALGAVKVFASPLPFDTSVVSERRVLSFDERMQRLEQRAERRELAIQSRLERAERDLEAARAAADEAATQKAVEAEAAAAQEPPTTEETEGQGSA